MKRYISLPLLLYFYLPLSLLFALSLTLIIASICHSQLCFSWAGQKVNSLILCCHYSTCAQCETYKLRFLSCHLVSSSKPPEERWGDEAEKCLRDSSLPLFSSSLLLLFQFFVFYFPLVFSLHAQGLCGCIMVPFFIRIEYIEYVWLMCRLRLPPHPLLPSPTPPLVCTGQTDANWGTPCNLIKGGPLSKTSRVCRGEERRGRQIPQHFTPTWREERGE